MARQLDVCVACRECVSVCAVFPLAFDQILATPHGEAGECTPAQQDAVVDECTFCGDCVALCGHATPPEAINIVELMARMQAVRFNAGLIGRPRITVRMGRLTPLGLRIRRAERRCIGGAYEGETQIGCCGAGARFVGDTDAADAARSKLFAEADERGLRWADVRFGDSRCLGEVSGPDTKSGSIDG